jgi:hypothetical protein
MTNASFGYVRRRFAFRFRVRVFHQSIEIVEMRVPDSIIAVHSRALIVSYVKPLGDRERVAESQVGVVTKLKA